MSAARTAMSSYAAAQNTIMPISWNVYNFYCNVVHFPWVYIINCTYMNDKLIWKYVCIYCTHFGIYRTKKSLFCTAFCVGKHIVQSAIYIWKKSLDQTRKNWTMFRIIKIFVYFLLAHLNCGNITFVIKYWKIFLI